MGERSITSKLVQLLSDTSLSNPLRAMIVMTLGKLGEHSVASKLGQLLSDASLADSVRGIAVEILEAVGGKDMTVLSDFPWGWVAETLGELEERTVVASELMRLLSDASLDVRVRRSIAKALGKLGERTVASKLMKLLPDASLDADLRRSIAEALKKLAIDPVSIRQLAHLLTHPMLANTAYDILWTVSRQAGVSIFPLQEPSDEIVEIVPWDDMARWR